MKKTDIMAVLAVEPEYPEFAIPAGLDVVDLEEGDEKEIVAKIRKKGDKLCLVEVNGIPLAEKEVEDEEYAEDEAEEASEEAFAAEGNSIENAARQSGLM
jgi:hypothetical protein